MADQGCKDVIARIVGALSDARTPKSFSNFPSNHSDFPENECIEDCNWESFSPTNYRLAARISPLLNAKGFHFIWLNYMKDFLENPRTLQGNEFTSDVVSVYGSEIENLFSDEIDRHFRSFPKEDLLLVADWANLVGFSECGINIDNFQGFIDRISILANEMN